MNYNRYIIHAQGRNKYGDYRKPVTIGKVPQNDVCTFTLSGLTIHYSDSSNQLLADQSNYATMTGTLTTYVDGEPRTSRIVNVTPIQARPDIGYVVTGNRIYWDIETYGTQTRAAAMASIRGIYAGTTADGATTIMLQANSRTLTSSRITSFEFPRNLSDAEMSYTATASATRTYTFTSGLEVYETISEIVEGEGKLELTSDVSWMYPVGNSVDVSHNVIGSRTGHLTVTDSLYPAANLTLTISQRGGSTLPGHVYLQIIPGTATPPPLVQNGDIDWTIQWNNEAGEVIASGNSQFMYGYAAAWGENDVNEQHNANEGYPITRTVYYELMLYDIQGTQIYYSPITGTTSYTITTAPTQGEERTEYLQLPNITLPNP